MDQVHEVKYSTPSVQWTLYNRHTCQQVKSVTYCLYERKKEPEINNQSFYRFTACPPSKLRQRYLSSGNGIWTDLVDNKAYRCVKRAACALVPYRRQTSVSVPRRTLLHNIRRQRRRWFDNIKVNITARERFIQCFGGETWGEEHTLKTYA